MDKIIADILYLKKCHQFNRNFYQLEPILIIFDTLHDETTGKIFKLTLAITWENIIHKNERFCSLPLKSVSDSAKRRLDHEGNQLRSAANVENDAPV